MIKVEYEVLPPVLDVLEATKAGAPVLLPELRTDELGEKGTTPTNVASHGQHARGDVEAGFAASDVIIEREFITNTVHQGYIEPHNATAQWTSDGNVTVWTSTQSAWGVREQVSQVAGVPIANVRVIPMEIGGGFGGKTLVYLDPVAALLSKHSGGRPVKLTMSRDEVLKATGPTSASVIRVKIGASKDGRLLAGQTWMAYEAGAFPGSPVGAAAGVIFAPYRFDSVLIDFYDVLVNKPKAEAYRAPGGTNAAFACEAVIDELAEKLKFDPLEFRRMNGVKEGDRRADGPTFNKIGVSRDHRRRADASALRQRQTESDTLGRARWPRRGVRLLVQLGRKIVGQRDRQPGWHNRLCRRQHRYRRSARLAGDAAG